MQLTVIKTTFKEIPLSRMLSQIEQNFSLKQNAIQRRNKTQEMDQRESERLWSFEQISTHCSLFLTSETQFGTQQERILLNVMMLLRRSFKLKQHKIKTKNFQLNRMLKWMQQSSLNYKVHYRLFVQLTHLLSKQSKNALFSLAKQLLFGFRS